jgi:hypothetical protein
MDVVFTAGRRHGGPFFLPYLEEGERREGKERRPNPLPQTHDEKPCPFSVQVPSLLPLVLFSPPPQGRSGKGKEGTDPFSSTTLRKVREEMDSNGGIATPHSPSSLPPRFPARVLYFLAPVYTAPLPVLHLQLLLLFSFSFIPPTSSSQTLHP